MKNALFAVLAIFFAATPVWGQLLYRVSGNGLQEPSYLLGTLHLASPAILDSIPGFGLALDQVGQVYGEVAAEEMATRESQEKMMKAMMLPDSVALSSLFSGEEMARLNQYTRMFMGADLSHPMMEGTFGRMKPSALSTTFTLMMYQKLMPEAGTSAGLDDYVMKVAQQRGKRVGGLETMDDQLNLLFDFAPLNRQAHLLMCQVDNAEYNVQLTKRLIEAYHQQDLQKINALMDEKLGNDCDATDEENDIMIAGRNRTWCRKIPDMMAQMPTMVVVGAAHLVGEEGLIQILRRKGFRVEGITR